MLRTSLERPAPGCRLAAHAIGQRLASEAHRCTGTVPAAADGRTPAGDDVRTRRATLKRDLKAGRQPIHELLLEPPEYLETAKVFDLLLAVPKYGRVKVNKILTQCRISPSKTIGGLSQRQRAELVALMRR